MKRLALAFLLVLASYSVSSAQQPVIVYSPASGTSQPQFPVTSTNPFPVVCESGCSGGGSSGAVFGPTAAGSAAANPPVLMCGTVDGTATGNVQGAAVKPASTAALQTDSAVVERNADIGAATDTTVYNGSGGCTLTACLKGLYAVQTSSLPAGSAIIGGAIPTAGASGGATPYHLLSTASTNATNVKNGTGTLYSITVINNTATAADLRIYNTASSPTCSSGTGVVANYGIQANTTSPGLSINLGAVGMALSTGISFCLTAYDGTDTNNSNAPTGLQVNLTYN